MSHLKNALNDLAQAQNEYYNAQAMSSHEHTSDIDQALDMVFIYEYEIIRLMQNPIDDPMANGPYGYII